VSEQVAKLEEEIGFEIFARVGHSIELTDAGRTFLGEAERVAGEFQGLARTAERLRGRRVESIALGMGSGLAQVFIPRLFPTLSERAPGLRLDVLTAPTKSIFRDLHEGRIDLGIAIETAPERVPAGLASERLLELDLGLVVHPEHSLARAAGPVDLGTLVAEPIVMSELTVVRRGDVAVHRPNAPEHPAVADNIETMKTVIRQGRGCAIMLAAAAAEEAAQGALRVLASNRPARSRWLCRRRTPRPRDGKRNSRCSPSFCAVWAPRRGPGRLPVSSACDKRRRSIRVRRRSHCTTAVQRDDPDAPAGGARSRLVLHLRP
jgi:DNA-binding transcriptional LysR family regulator